MVENTRVRRRNTARLFSSLERVPPTSEAIGVVALAVSMG